MNLCIDVGNTTVGVGFFKEEQLHKRLSFTVDTKKTSDEYISVIERTLKDLSLDATQIDRILFSSVVPSVNDELISAVKTIFNKEPLLIAPVLKPGSQYMLIILVKLAMTSSPLWSAQKKNMVIHV